VYNLVSITLAFYLFITPAFAEVITQENAELEMVQLEGFWIDKKEVSIGQFSRYASSTALQTKAETEGGGLVYEWGWRQKQGWNWRTPFGKAAHPDEPAVHLSFDEAAAYCKWAGKQLPTEAQWISAAYTEQRKNLPASSPFKRGVTYPFPTGDSPKGANCLEGCGTTPIINNESLLNRGRGHAKVGTTQPGVNGLFDMGANVWEWVDISDDTEKGTRGGSWWYGPSKMKADSRATKPREMSVVYIGFRCVKPHE